MKQAVPSEIPIAGQTAFLLDEVWPEYASYVQAMQSPDDQVIAPGFFGKPIIGRYHWPGQVTHGATTATIWRHIAMRKVAQKSGAIRQRTYLRHDRALAHALSRKLDYRARHLVISQNLLPHLFRAGLLGGRSYDVLMTRYPIFEIHRRLDGLAAAYGGSKTISDFRADNALISHECDALKAARHIVTPHHDIASLFPDQTRLLSWHRPTRIEKPSGTRTAFLGPVLARQRPDIARRIASELDQPLIIFGQELEEHQWWQGIEIERRPKDDNWLDDIGTIIQAGLMVNQPRDLLQAQASGVQILASPGCGLASDEFVSFENYVNHPNQNEDIL